MTARTVDLRDHLRPGDLVVWGQACAEPRTLTGRLVEQADEIGSLRCFAGIPVGSAVSGDLPETLSVLSYCGTGSNAALHAAGRLDILPVHYSRLPDLLSTGPLRANVVLVQVSAPDEHGRHSLGLADDYFSAAIDNARVVIAEVNKQVPFTLGARTLRPEEITASVQVSEPPAELPTPVFDEVSRAVAARVASLVEDGATLQFGIGGMPSAVLRALGGHRDLGIHSGIVNDAALDLIEAGVVTNARKTRDRGVTIGGLFVGTQRLFRFADRNPAIELRSTRYTHDLDVLGSSHKLTAINAAIQVDLTGQINAETVGGRYVGAVGGAVDFVRGANRSVGGLPIIALPSTARGRSRIVARLDGPVTTPRSEPVVVVTEQGIADLRGLTVAQRVDAMLALAHPSHRADLDAVADRVLAHAFRPSRENT